LRRPGLLARPEESFERVTRLARRLLDTPAAVVSLVEADRRSCRPNQADDIAEIPDGISLCPHPNSTCDVLRDVDGADDCRVAHESVPVEYRRVAFCAGCPIAAPDGSPIGTLCVIDYHPRTMSSADIGVLHDLAAIVEEQLLMRQLAIDDDLTGLTNHRGFDLIAEQALAVCRRQHHTALVLFADIDGLKITNDTQGHTAGDDLIRQAANVIRGSLRDADVVARVGGDEFAAFLSDYEGDRSIAVDRMVNAVTRHNAIRDDGSCHLSISVGTAQFDPATPETLAALIERADTDMYRIKRHNRLTPTPQLNR